MSFPKYPRYKDSGILWFGDIPEHWSMRRLGWICSNINDINHEMPEAVYEGVPFLSNKDLLDDGTLNFKSNVKLISEEDFERLSQKIRPQRDDIIYSRIGTLGKARLVETDQRFLISYSCCVVRVSEEAVCKKFICHLLDGEMLLTEARMRTKGIGVPDLGLGEISRFPIPLPTRDDQTKISSFLDRETSKIDALVGEQRRLIELLKEKRQAVISHAVTKGLNPNAPLKPSGIEWLGNVPEKWRVVQVRRIGTVGQGSAFAHAIQGNEVGELAWFKVSDMNREGNETYMRSAANYVDRSLAEKLDVTVFPAGTIIFPRVGAALLTNKRRALSCPAVIDDNIYGVIPTAIDSRFLYSVLLLVDMACLCSPGLVPTVTFGVIKDLYVPMPTLEEQESIVEHIDQQVGKLDALTAEAERGIELLQERRTALISAAVTGKIDVRGLLDDENMNMQRKVATDGREKL